MKRFIMIMLLCSLVAAPIFAGDGFKYHLRGGMDLSYYGYSTGYYSYKYIYVNPTVDLFIDNIPKLEKFMNFGKIAIRPYIGTKILPMRAYNTSGRRTSTWKFGLSGTSVLAIIGSMYTGTNIEYDITDKIDGYEYFKATLSYEMPFLYNSGYTPLLKIGVRAKKSDDGKELNAGIGLLNAWGLFGKLGFNLN